MQQAGSTGTEASHSGLPEHYPLADASSSSSLAILAAFNLTLFASAFLLFSVEPMVSRMVLPRLGGSPAVWNTCVCFFQAALLLGYAYADWLAIRLSMRYQLLAHSAVLLLGLAVMPLSIGTAIPPPDASPALWLLARLTLTVGPPFFAISATAPLMQHWFSRTTERRANDPYFLYAASNAGSLIALLSYPALAEPFLGLSMQTKWWSAAFAMCAVSVVACGLMALNRQGKARAAAAHSAHNSHLQAAGLPLRAQLRWVALSFVPSGFMLAVTTYITTDIAAAPLFWVIPLAIYMLTFMLAFGRSRRAMPRFLPLLQAVALVAAGVTALMGMPSLLSLAIALTAFGLTALVCHFELANARPDPSALTRYFFLISVGGALGGIFNALLAPLLFKGPWEYPLLIIAACLIRPASARPDEPHIEAAPAREAGWLRPLALLVIGAALIYGASPLAPASIRPVAIACAIGLPAAALIWFSQGGAYLGIGMASLLLLPMVVRSYDTEYNTRSFFGTYRVIHLQPENLTVLLHGTTLHGVQGDLPSETATPYGYYGRTGPFGRLFAAFHKDRPSFGSVGVIGLGAGALGCYAQPGERWVFREIDPTVERIARNNRFFHFMQSCGNNPQVVIGDARITLSQDTAARYGLLIIDAFSSDSVPVHLLTREALRLYLSRLTPGGVVVFHISNRYLNLAPVVSRLAADEGAASRHLLLPASQPGTRYSAAELIAVAANPASLSRLTADGWDDPKPGPVLWTDDRSDIARVIRW